MLRKNNSFNLLRIIAALLVLISHQYALNAMPEPLVFQKYSFGTFGVGVFFMLSGFLLIDSWLRNRDIFVFLVNRIFRIIPGLAVSVVLCAFIMGPLFTELSILNYLGTIGTYEYLLNIFLISKYNLPEVFLKNPYPAVVNGSLWTLPFEVLCYTSLVIVGYILKNKNKLTSIMYVSALVCMVAIAAPSIAHEKYWRYFELILFFYVGVMLYFCKHADSGNKINLIFLVIILLFLSLLNWDLFKVVVALLGITISFYYVNILNPLFEKLGDLSYGLYIYGFPVQRVIVYSMGDSLSVVEQIFTTTLLVGSISWVSWWFIESPSLRFKVFLRNRLGDYEKKSVY